MKCVWTWTRFQFHACDRYLGEPLWRSTSELLNVPVGPACECYRVTVYHLIRAAYQMLSLISSVKFRFSTAGRNQTSPQLLVFLELELKSQAWNNHCCAQGDETWHWPGKPLQHVGQGGQFTWTNTNRYASGVLGRGTTQATNNLHVTTHYTEEPLVTWPVVAVLATLRSWTLAQILRCPRHTSAQTTVDITG